MRASGTAALLVGDTLKKFQIFDADIIDEIPQTASSNRDRQPTFPIHPVTTLTHKHEKVSCLSLAKFHAVSIVSVPTYRIYH